MASILVTGATGNVGSAALEALMAAGIPARVAQRPTETAQTPEGEEGKSLAELVAFDFTDSSTWDAAFNGIDVMFLVRPPAIGNVKRDLLPAVAAAQKAGVRHVVFLSLQGAEKNKIVPHATVEKWLRTSGMDWTFVRASFFDQNLSTTHASDIRDLNEIVVPAGRGATAFVDALDVGAVAAAALMNPDVHRNVSWTVTGPRALTYSEVADILSLELGREIRYNRPGVIRYVRHARKNLGLPWGMVVVTTAIYTTARLGMAAGLTQDVTTVLGRKPIDFPEFAHRERAVWLS